MSKKPFWSGIFPAVTTQFSKEGALDLAATQTEVDALLKAGVHGLIMLGTCGENCSLLPEEKRQVLAATKEVVKGRVPIVSGVSEYTTALGCQYAKDAEKIGIDGLMVLPGMVYKADAREAVAHFLEGHAKVARVLYPGLKSHPQHALAMKQMEMGGNVIAFDIAGGRAGAFRFANALKIIKISNNLGDAKSLITHPATTTHQRLTPEQREIVGITEGLVRLSVGLEDPRDLIEDLDAALRHV